MHTRLRLLLPAFILTAAIAAAGDSWPGFRGPSADGHARDAKLLTTWSEDDNVLWKTEIHGKAWSSPVVLGNQVWVTTADELLADKMPPAKGGAPPNPVKEVTFFAVCV